MRLAALLLVGASIAASVSAAEPAAVERTRAGAGELIAAPLDGALVAALALPERRELLLLVRPAAEIDGPRRLLRLTLGDEPRLEPVAEGIGGWVKRLAALELASDGGGLELVASGLGRLDGLGPVAAPRADGRTLIDHPGFDLRALEPARLRVGTDRELVGVEVGWLRLWTPDGSGDVTLAAEHPLPFAVERIETGLRLTGTRVAVLPRAGGGARYAVGPEPAGAMRLRLVVLERSETGWSEQVAWLALPSPERLEQQWLVELDGEPALVARAQGAAELDVFERQRWRAWRLGADRTRAGRAPLLAIEVDSKRWHDGAATTADVDGDGRDDLIVVRPEGLSGSELAVEVRRGRGDGRLEPRARRRDLAEAGDDWLLIDAAAAGGRPALAVQRQGRLELFRFEAGRRVLGEAGPAIEVGGQPWAAGGVELIGALALGAEAPPLLVAAAADRDGRERLLVLRATAR